MILPKLYAISLMYTLNLRNEMLAEQTSHERSATGSLTYPAIPGVGKQSFLPRKSSGFIAGGGARDVVNVSGKGAGGNVSSGMERGVGFIGGKGRMLSFSGQGGQARKVDGIHVETHVSRDGGSSGNAMEVSDFGIPKALVLLTISLSYGVSKAKDRLARLSLNRIRKSNRMCGTQI
jgi:hypothetical protein